MAEMAENFLSFFHSITSKSNENVSIHNNIGGDVGDEEVILAHLNELRQWQESQRKTLSERQSDQQKLLEIEKRKLYELFGLNASDSTLQDATACSSDTSYNLPASVNLHDTDDETPKKSEYANEPALNEKKLHELHSPSINQLQKIVENMAVRSPRHDRNPNEQIANVPKRPFLKRGAGLKNRFKMSPDAFRLDKLPKYKYAQRMQKHAQLIQSHKKRHHQEITTNDTASTAGIGVGTASEGHQNNAKAACTLPSSHQNENNKKSNQNARRPNPKAIQLKLKPSTAPNSDQSKLKSLSSDGDAVFLHHNKQDVLESKQLKQPTASKSAPNPLSPVTKLLLDTPTRERVQLQQDEINELKRFVELEKDFNKNNSESPMDKARRDDNLAHKFKLGLNVSPKRLIANRNIDDIEEEDEKEEQLQHSISSESSMGDESRHVRFMPNAVAIDKHSQHLVCDELSAIYDVPRTSSPNESSTESFQKFKEKLFDRRLKQKFQNRLSVAKDFEISDLNSNKSDCDDENTLATALDFNETDKDNANKKLIQERLLSLEEEIKSFREQNNELTKLIREHEMIRLSFDDEQHEAQKRMESERINFEMYMHNQRLKMLDEKAKWEKRTKESRGLTQTEKNELMSLREKCANHEVELSAREQKHVAAQGRIRAQLRNVEKELKEARFELDNLQRENKKLEVENMRLRRQGNSKILNEINKSISKLAHSSENDNNQHENEKDGAREKALKHGVKKCSNTNAHKTVVAKVTSRREPLKGSQIRSKSVPNLQQTDGSEKYSYELCSPNASDGENSEGSSHEGNGMDKSSYFRSHSNNKVRIQASGSTEDDEYDKAISSQCDESDSASTSLKRIIENPDGSKDIWYPNGNLKKISADGMCIRIMYFNKDIKETDIKEGIVKYYYAETNTWQTTYLDGLEIFEYPGGQTEHRQKNGTVEIYFPNGSVRITNPDREQNEGIKEEWKYADGSNAIQLTNGERMLILPNGQREVHANGHKRREYPDGTVKIVYPDGSQETRYSNGRVRLKNKDGKLIMDSETISI